MKTEKATFAAGCFWGVQAAFGKIKGIVSTEAGYTGGHTKNPSYVQVCSGNTGHAEAVRIIFDPLVVSYEKLLNMFWKIHDPTQVDRQGPDFGSQYRSAIFYTSLVQKDEALSSKAKMQQNSSIPIATIIARASKFFSAEEYHQKYFEKNGSSCHT